MSAAEPPYQRPNLHVVGEGREILERIAAGDPLPYLAHPQAHIRRLAVAACGPLGTAAIGPLAQVADDDPDDHTRAEAIEILGTFGPQAFEAVWAARGDTATRVTEAVASALGEVGDGRAVDWLLETLSEHPEPIVREAAVAALGAIGEDRSLPAVLEAARSGKPQIRRRAVVALTAFDGAEVEQALAAARLDRNPMVREVAEMLLGREVDTT